MAASAFALASVLLVAAAAQAWPPERTAGDLPTPQQLAWQDLELGMFCHFGPNTFMDAEWGDGKASPDVFNPSQFDARQWVAAAKDSGMKYLVVTAKHHDGFCLWPTRQTDYCVRSSKWRDGKGDVIREVADACHAAGIALGIYLSPWDRHERSYADNAAYDRHYMAQMTELLSNYGTVTEFWADGAGGEGHVYDWAAYYRHLKSLQPECLWAIAGVADIRWVGNEDGVAPESLWNVVDVGGQPYWWPAECDARIRRNWFWHPGDADTLKSVGALLEMYHVSVGHGAGLLLNVAPDDRGLLPDDDVKRLREWGDALRAIYARDVLAGKRVRGSSESKGHPARHALDGKLHTCWLAGPDDREASIEVTLDRPVVLDRFVMQEAIGLGQRIREYAVEVRNGGGWTRACAGTSIGHKKIDILEKTVTVHGIRLTLKGTAPPALRSFSAYLAPEAYRHSGD